MTHEAQIQHEHHAKRETCLMAPERQYLSTSLRRHARTIAWMQKFIDPLLLRHHRQIATEVGNMIDFEAIGRHAEITAEVAEVGKNMIDFEAIGRHAEIAAEVAEVGKNMIDFEAIGRHAEIAAEVAEVGKNMIDFEAIGRHAEIAAEVRKVFATSQGRWMDEMGRFIDPLTLRWATEVGKAFRPTHDRWMRDVVSFIDGPTLQWAQQLAKGHLTAIDSSIAKQLRTVGEVATSRLGEQLSRELFSLGETAAKDLAGVSADDFGSSKQEAASPNGSTSDSRFLYWALGLTVTALATATAVADEALARGLAILIACIVLLIAHDPGRS